MVRRLLVGAILLVFPVAFSAASYVEEKGGKRPTAPPNAAFEALKKLEGTWLTVDKEGKPTDQVQSIIKVTAGGSAVHETHFPGQPQEMISVYTLDGPDLIMTHFCVLGNQPRLKADPKSPANQIVWKFTGGGNLDVKKDKHMHEGTVTFVDDDHIEWKWAAWNEGKPVDGHKIAMKLVRKK